MNELRDQIADLPRRISDRLAEAWPDLRDDPVYLDQLGEEAAKVVQPGDFRDFCGASAVGLFGVTLGPCILRHGHDGPLHEDAKRQQWTHSITMTGEHDGLRDQVEEAIRRVGLARNLASYSSAAWVVIKPVLDGKDAEIERLKKDLHRADAKAALREAVREDAETDMETLSEERDEAEERAAQAEAERDRLRLAWESARRGRRHMRSLLVDTIRHMGNADERAKQAETTIARSLAALAAFESRGVNNFDIPAPGEIRDAWRASLDEGRAAGRRPCLKDHRQSSRSAT